MTRLGRQVAPESGSGRGIRPVSRSTHPRILRLIALAAASVAVIVAASVAAAGFDDDEGNVHEPAIDALAGAGIIEGSECGEGLICPGDPFER